VLRYDKRGLGRSTGDFAHATTPDFAGDAISAWDFLAKRPEVRATRAGPALGFVVEHLGTLRGIPRRKLSRDHHLQLAQPAELPYG
jgi:hypothetical protein